MDCLNRQLLLGDKLKPHRSQYAKEAPFDSMGLPCKTFVSLIPGRFRNLFSIQGGELPARPMQAAQMVNREGKISTTAIAIPADPPRF
jgi:hypothetical protein